MTLARIESAYDDRRSWVGLMVPAVELAKAIAATDFVPRAMRNNPAAISAAILYGDEVGLGPMQSLAKIAVIEGRPFMAAESQRALVLAAGHELWIDELTATRCTWCGRREGRDAITRVTWTIDDARRAGLAGKQNWRTYPRQMLSARASAELVRAVFADVVGGISALEEFDDVDVLDVDTVEPGVAIAGTPAPVKRRRARSRTGNGGAKPPSIDKAQAPADGLPPLPGEPSAQQQLDEQVAASNARLHDLQADLGEPDEPQLATSAQKRRMHALMRDRGVIERGDRLRLTTAVIGRVVASSTELTTAEADVLLDYLESTPEVDGAQQALDVDEVGPDDEMGGE